MKNKFYALLPLFVAGFASSNAQTIIAQRTGGVAPLGVHFTVSETNWDSLKNTDYEWIFPGGDTVVGFQAVHTFHNSGNVTLKITRADNSRSTQTVAVNVQDPNTVYAGTKTTCISTSGNFTGCPSGAMTITADTLINTNFSAYQRFLFCQGETFDLTLTKTLLANTYIGSYGGGKATIRVSGDATTTTFWMQDSITVTDIAFHGAEWVLSSAWGQNMYGEGRLFAPENHTTLHNLDIRYMTAFAIMDDNIGAKKNLVIDSVHAENLGSYFFYAGPSPSVEYSGVRHSKIYNVMSNHGMRLNGGRYFTASEVHIDSVERSHITYRGLRYGTVADSRFTGKGLYKNSIRNISDDASTADSVKYIIFERNRYQSRDNEFAIDFTIGTDIVVRNNLLLNSSLNVGFNNGGVVPQRVDVLHNTFYQNNFGWYSLVSLRANGSGSFKGNVAYADNCTNSCADENPFPAHSGQNPALWKIDNNAYYVSGDATGADFKSGMNFTAWQALGLDTASGYGAMNFNNMTANLATANFTPVSGVMLNRTPFLTHRDLLKQHRRHAANNDAGAIETDPFVSVENTLAANRGLAIFPNPVANVLHVKTGMAQVAHISVYNSMGQLMYAAKGTVNSVDVATFAPGIYMLKVQDVNGQTAAASFIKQ